MEEHLCIYCNRPAKFQFKNKKWCCSENMNKCPVIVQKRIESSKNQWKNRKDNNCYSSKSTYHQMGIQTSRMSEMKQYEKVPDGYCEYGCGNLAKYTLKNGRKCCSEHSCQCPVIKQKNKQGVLNAYNDGKLNAKEMYKNMPKESKDKMCWIKKGSCLVNPDDFFKRDNINLDTLMRMINSKLINLEYKCHDCGNTGIWNNKPIKLELHHLDGNHHNNNINNLTFLCPNCHSQTNTYRNRGTSRWLTDEEIKIFLEENLPKYNNNINELLQYQKVKNQSYVYRKYIDLYINKIDITKIT